jgi:hypothetical protein
MCGRECDNARALEDSNARGPKAVRPDGERACRMLANARTMNAMAVKAVREQDVAGIGGTSRIEKTAMRGTS